LCCGVMVQGEGLKILASYGTTYMEPGKFYLVKFYYGCKTPTTVPVGESLQAMCGARVGGGLEQPKPQA
jgi:hypothetical protein